MKAVLLLFYCMITLALKAQPSTEPPNIFIITIDGFRWQELFMGADSALIHNPHFTKDTTLAKRMYWAVTPDERRKRLLPFLWNVVAVQGQLLGNRTYGNEVNVANPYKISYAGYNEMLTGTTDLRIFSNSKKYNTHRNILEKLDNDPAYHGKIVAFSSWDVFPYILNQPRHHIPINSGYQNEGDTTNMISAVEQYGIAQKAATRYDLLTFVTAMDYIEHHRPKVVYLGFGEADEFAHSGRYDRYLQSANKFDSMLEELWYKVQTTPGYANNTSFIITTDHGRGSKNPAAWQAHGTFVQGSGEVWRAAIGPAFEPLGEIMEADRQYQKNLPGLIVQVASNRQVSANNSLAAGR